MPATNAKIAQGEVSRERLMEAAAEVIGEKGVAKASVAAITERAGVVKSALYHHFGSKNGLLHAMLVHRADRWIQGMWGAVEEAGSAPGARLDALVGRLQKLMTEQPGNRRMLFSLVLEETNDSAFREAALLAYSTVRGAMRDGIMATVSIDETRAAIMADAFVDMIDGLFLRFQLERNEARLDEALGELRRMMIARIENELRRSIR